MCPWGDGILAMKHYKTAILAVMVVVGSLAALPLSGAAALDAGGQPSATIATQTNDATNNSTVAPGERLSGVVSVQQAELDGEVQTRAFDIAFERADDNASKAEVIARQSSNLETRVAELEERKATLTEARENGSISDGEYQARIASLAAETETTKQLANRSSAAAERLPADVLESKGVNVSAIQTLATRAEELTGPEVQEIARRIAGDDQGEADRGADERPDANETDTDRDRQDGERTSTSTQHAPEQGDDRAGDGRQTSAEDGEYTPTPTEDGNDRQTADDDRASEQP